MKRVCFAVLIVFASVHALFAQGSLTPPGPPMPMMKTLEQVEPRTPITSLPFTINTPGSYYVVSNLSGANAPGIVIATNNVTIDLNGFVLRGAGNFSAINTSVGCTNIVVMNGTVINWGFGVFLGDVDGLRIVNVQASDNASFGIYAGRNAIIENCRATANAAGIAADSGSRMVGCVASSNLHTGCWLVGTPGTIANCVAVGNGFDGITATRHAIISDCLASGNGRHGIAALDHSLVKNCLGNGNGTNGINLRSESTVRESAAHNNGSDGISAGGDCVIVGNNSTRNGVSGEGAGVRGGGGCRIEGNHVYANDYGVVVPAGARNLIIRNSFFANGTNILGGGGNIVGPIVDNSNIATNSSPHANYSL
jgi:parallel beta-helix repeat protein